MTLVNNLYKFSFPLYIKTYKITLYILAFSIIFLLQNAIAQNEGPKTYKIIGITVQGNNNYESNMIVANSGLIIGSEIAIPSDETREAILRLWNLKLFNDIQILIDKKVENGAYLVIKVTELPKLESVKFSGNTEFSQKDLLEKLGLAVGQVIRNQDLKDIQYSIKKYYIEEGYSMIEDTVYLVKKSDYESRIYVDIKEGKKVSVYKISFEGNKNISSSDLRGAMDETSEKKWWKFWDKARFNRKNYESDKKLIVDYYKEKGYKDAFIVNDNLSLSSDREEMNIRIKINEGLKYYIGNITYEGNKIYPDSILSQRMDFKTGDVYNLKKFEQNLRGNESQSDVAALYLDNGYLGFQADVEEFIKEKNRVDIHIKITENQQFKIGVVSFSGNTKTQDKVIRRELYTYPNQYFNRTNMIRSLRQISTLNYFNPEKLSYDFVQRNDTTVDLVYMLEEKSSDQLNASIGYSATFGLSGSIGLVFNNFDITDPLSGGAGQILSFQWDFGTGGTYQTFSIGFTEPFLFDSPTLLGINIFDTKQSYTYTIRETGGTVSFGRRFKFPDDYFRGDWFVKYQRTQVIDGAGIYETGIRTQISVGQTISRNSVDNPIFPTTGSKLSLYSELAGANVLGSISFHKHMFSAEAYHTLFHKLFGLNELVLYSNFQFGAISSLAKDNYIPPNEYLFMGGSGLAYNTTALRGYDDRAVGPVNIYGNPTGGKVLLKYGIELRYSLSLDPIPIYLILFGEAGNVWAGFKQADLLDLRRSVGFGARVVMPPIGIIGFDLGYGFDRRIVSGVDPAWIFHFQFGRGL